MKLTNMGNWECYILDSKILFCCPVVPYMFNLCMKVVRNPQISGGDTGKEGGGGEKDRVQECQGGSSL